MTHDQDRPRVQWEVAKEFREGEVAVNVLRLPLRFPKYALEVGSVWTDQQGEAKMGRRIPINTVGRGDDAGIKSQMQIIEHLVLQAETWIRDQVRATEAEAAQNRPARPAKQFDNDKPKFQKAAAPMGLKAMKKRDKAAWEAKKAAQEGKADDAST